MTKLAIIFVAWFSILFITVGYSSQISDIDKSKLIEKLHNFEKLDNKNKFSVLDSADIYVQAQDTSVVSLLFDLTFNSDGIISEMVGTILGTLFLNNTEFFLENLSKRTEYQQSHIAAQAFYMDGSGMPPLWFDKIEQKLKEMASDKENEFYQIANVCLSSLKIVKNHIK
jgi:hypothetical protein